MLDEFTTTSQGLLHNLEQAVADGETETIKLTAHRMAGTAALLGLPGLNAVCTRISAEPGGWQGAAGVEVTTELRKTHAQTLAALAEYRLGLSSGEGAAPAPPSGHR